MPLNNSLHGEVCFSICVHSRMPYEAHSCRQFPLPELYERFHKAKSWRHKQTRFSLFIAWQKVVPQQANNRKYVLLWPGIACHIYSNSRWNIHRGTDFMFAFCVVGKKKPSCSANQISAAHYLWVNLCCFNEWDTRWEKNNLVLASQSTARPFKSSC